MARNEKTAEQLDAIATSLVDASESIKAMASAMRDSGLPTALVHGNTALNLHLPSLLEWIDKTAADVKIQVRSYLAGTQSKAEQLKQQSEKQKLAAGKKKAVKKKTV